MHFYADDKRAVDEAQALKDGDFNRYLTLVNESGLSSELQLQNIWSPSTHKEQAISLALTIGKGAIRVYGNGFAGTIQAFVPNELLNRFNCGMETVFGEGKCHGLRIRPQGKRVVAE